MHALPLYVLFCSYICSSVVSCFRRVFSFRSHVFSCSFFCFLCPWPPLKNKFMELPQIQKNLFVYLFFCCALFHIYVLHVCPSFFWSIFPFWFILICFWTCFFLFSFLNVFPLLLPFFMYRFFWGLCSVWSSFFSPFVFSSVTYSLFFRKNHVVLIWFRLYWFFFWKCVSCWLVLKSEKCSFVFSLSSCFSLLKKILAFFASLYSKQKLCRKNFMFFCLSVPFSFRVFLSSVFHVVFCLIFLDLLRNMLLYLFISSFCSSSFHLISLFCLLLFSRFFHLLSPSLNFLFGSFRYLHVSWSQTLCATKKSIFLGFCQDLLFSLLFSIKKTSFSLFPFLLCFFKNYVIFPCLVFFSVLKNDFSFCITLVSFASYFELCFFFLLSFFLMYPERRTLFLLENVGKTFYCFLFLFSWFKKHCVRKKKTVRFSSIFVFFYPFLPSL